MQKNRRSKKVLSIFFCLLFFGTLISSGTSVQTKNRQTQDPSRLQTPLEEKIHFRLPYRVLGCGDGWWIDPFNTTWHGNLHETYKNYTYQTYGYYYKTCIYIVNCGGMLTGLYCLFIRDRETRTLYNKTELPYQFIIYNFTGYISLMFYGYPHGPDGCTFVLRGYAESFKAYSP